MDNANQPLEAVYDIHVFCCTNERPSDHPRSSCAARGSQSLHQHLKARTKELGLTGLRINKAGCLDRCELGPVMVIYPLGIWYNFQTIEDIEEILQSHIINGKKIDRLWLPAGQSTPKVRTEAKLKLVVSEITDLTDQIRRIVFKPQEGEQLPSFTAGSHIDLFTGNGLRRSYSLANSPIQHGYYEIAVLKEPKGRGGSQWVHENLNKGDCIEATSPTNQFELDQTAASFLLIAGGIGITPLLSMGRHLSSLGIKPTLHYCTRSPEQTPFINEIKDVFKDQVFFHHDGGDYTKGIDLNQVLAAPTKNQSVYICGPAGLIDAACKASKHWPEGSVHIERFQAPELMEPLKNQPFDVMLSRQGVSLHVAADKTILQAIKEAGIEVDSSCETGVCGTCKTGLLKGNVEHRDSVLSPEEKASQKSLMICSSRALPGETLILDL